MFGVLVQSLRLTLLGCVPALLPAAAWGDAAGQGEPTRIETSDRQQLAATFYPPTKTSGLAPGVLLVHDAGGSRRQLSQLAERLQKTGFAVLALDLRHHGESSTGGKAWSQLGNEEQVTAWAFAPRDLEAAAQWLSRRKDVHSTNISVVGLRAGSTLAVRHAARDQNIMSVVLIAPQAQQFGFDLQNEIQDLAGLPTCILARREERSTAEAISERGNRNGGDPYIHILLSSSKDEGPDAPEGFDDRRQIADVVKWLREQATPKRGQR